MNRLSDAYLCAGCGLKKDEAAAVGIWQSKNQRRTIAYWLCPACAAIAIGDPAAMAATVELRLLPAEGSA